MKRWGEKRSTSWKIEDVGKRRGGKSRRGRKGHRVEDKVRASSH